MVLRVFRWNPGSRERLQKYWVKARQGMTVLDALVDFASFKAAFGGADDELLAVLRDPAADPGPDEPLLALTRSPLNRRRMIAIASS